jgi:adenosylcobinamide kinase/adenosylcobinamide-phosphate guanylyltransferase
MTLSTLIVLGGARSGKSRYAQQRAEAEMGALIYIATGQALDAEMKERIAHHQADRGDRWRTVEAPLALASTIRAETAPNRVLLVDCLTLWVSNLMLADRDAEAEGAALVECIAKVEGGLILVSNEVGLGIVPDNAMARRFRDIAGRINQTVARAVDEAVFVAAGLPLVLKTALPIAVPR